MPVQRPDPARPWYDLVKEQTAIRGWSVNELAKRAKVGRPTIYGWRDKPNPPWPGPVNAVADVLGIPRERALRLAGIITDGDGDGRPSPREPSLPPQLPPDLQELMREEVGDEMAARLIAHYEHLIAGRLPPAGGRRRQEPGTGEQRSAG